MLHRPHRPWPALLVVAFVALAACKGHAPPRAHEQASPDAPASHVVPALADLSLSLDALRTEFDAHRGQGRMLALLAPTWGACLHGARAVSQVVVHAAPASAVGSLAPIVAWIPMLDADELPAASAASARFADAPVPQFWDGAQRLGKEVARSLDAPDWIAWDVYLFYPPGAAWTARGLPAPEVALAQAGGVVVATHGALPVVELPNTVPPSLRGRVDVVGEQASLEALLTAVADGFARRHAGGVAAP